MIGIPSRLFGFRSPATLDGLRQVVEVAWVYLLDSNVFIQAKNSHYGYAICPGFWDWILQSRAIDRVFTIETVRDELMVGNDDLSR